MRQFLARAIHGQYGVYVKFLTALSLIVIAIFAYLSSASCEGQGSGNGCGSNSQTSFSSSGMIYIQDVNKTAFDANMAGPVGPFLPHATVHRVLAFAGNGVTRSTWSPPPGASGFNFTGPPQPQPGGPPFVFLSPPSSFTVTYSLPYLPSGMDSRKVSETLSCDGADGSSSSASLVDTITRTPVSADEAQPLPAAPLAPSATQAVPMYVVEQYRSINNLPMTTALCQSMYDWLQGTTAFTALRVPVTITGSASSFSLPVIFGPQANTRPVIQFTIKGGPVPGLPDVPLELRPDRMTYLENNLPTAAGENWLALGVAASPKVTCPTIVNQPDWEFHFKFPPSWSYWSSTARRSAAATGPFLVFSWLWT